MWLVACETANLVGIMRTHVTTCISYRRRLERLACDREHPSAACSQCVSWVVTLRSKVKASGDGALPPLVAIVTDAGSASKEQGNFIIKDAASTSMSFWGSPFRCAAGAAQMLC